ncbi:hypothetical protein P3S68_022139 [Capsicum galapagoense]
MSLRESLSNVKKVNLFITSYLSKIKQICSTLALVDIQILINELFLHALHGLPAEYDTITIALRARKILVTFEELHEKLLDFERNLVRSSFSTIFSITANFVAKSSPHNNYSRSNNALRPRNNSNQLVANNIDAQFAGQNTTGIAHVLLMDIQEISNTQLQTQQPRVKSVPHNNNNNKNWLVDSSTSHHVTQDLQNLFLHSDYDGSEDIMLVGGLLHEGTSTSRET